MIKNKLVNIDNENIGHRIIINALTVNVNHHKKCWFINKIIMSDVFIFMQICDLLNCGDDNTVSSIIASTIELT